MTSKSQDRDTLGKELLNDEMGGIVNFIQTNKCLLAAILAPNVSTLPTFND